MKLSSEHLHSQTVRAEILIEYQKIPCTVYIINLRAFPTSEFLAIFAVKLIVFSTVTGPRPQIVIIGLSHFCPSMKNTFQCLLNDLMYYIYIIF